MLHYLIGLLKYLLYPKISKFAYIHYKSNISKYSKIKSGAKIFQSTINRYSYVSRNTALYYTTVGKFCSIGMDSKIGLPTHTISHLSTSPIFTEKNNATGFTWSDRTLNTPYKPVKIGNDVWIGDNVIILGGVTIGNGAVIGAGAIVTKDVPDYSIVAGIPAHIIRYRYNHEIINMLNNIKWWNLSSSFLKKNLFFFQQQNITQELIENLINKIQCHNEYSNS